ncbi:hypothetical protein J2W49_002635 [Hydrogenophaga palleronii]|uniref:Uncharacterized protein n=1 Tax=Hydrogenophaga palleronii TaxID=65655 RepID=A0ABU1WN12_9BURK|nr:hypothetical protein [Hydrogenophaga palleronii]MDR7150672.1 hypothetical protein [Hydrogenophaga palleronii]
MSTTLLRLFGGLFMLIVMPSALCAPPASDAFPRLSDNTAGSATLEVRKVLQGQVDGMFVVPRTRQVVAAAGGYLWKFSDQGMLQDTLRVHGSLFTSGVVFTAEHFVDWVFTGSAQRKSYGAPVDGSALSHAEVVTALEQADVVEFGKSDDTTAWAYLWSNGQAHKMDLSRHIDKVDIYCHRRTHSAKGLRWKTTCFEGLPPAARAWVEVDPGSFANISDTQARVDVVGFDRRRFHLEEGLDGQLVGATVGAALKAMGMPGSLPGRYWFGDAHTRLRVGGEVVQFKAFVPLEDGEYRFMHNMRWWEPASTLPGASPWFSVHMRGYMEHKGEAELLRHYEKDIGLYVVRPRGVADVPAAMRTVPAWRPVFEGPVTRGAAVTGTVEFAAPPTDSTGQGETTLPAAHVWLRSPPPGRHVEGVQPPVPVDALWPALHQLPSALTVAWGQPWQEQEHTVVRIDLVRSETQEVLGRLLGGGASNAMKLADATRAPASRDRKDRSGADSAAARDPLELVVRVPDLKAPLDQGQVLLRSGRRQLPLLQARMTYVVQPVERADRQTSLPPASPPGTTALLQQLQTAVTEASSNAGAGLPDFLNKAQTLAQDATRAKVLATHVTAAYAQLINQFNRASDFVSSAALVRHYLAQVHPHIGHLTGDNSQTYNQGVIASQTLAFAIHSPPHRDLVDGVMAKLIGADFDPQLQTNGTLMYNLACHYALGGDKPRLLQSAAAARRLGKPRTQFMADKDFERYWEDAEFLQVLR